MRGNLIIARALRHPGGQVKFLPSGRVPRLPKPGKHGAPVIFQHVVPEK
jgi:hypothetical protein